MATPPQFAFSLREPATELHGKGLKLASNYHFASNRPGAPGVYFEVRLKDAEGNVVGTHRFPDEDANPWVRHRQDLLARHLATDVPVMPPQGELIGAPGQAVPTIRIWDVVKPFSLTVKSVPQHLVPRDRDVWAPSDWSLVLARSYVRHLRREHGAHSGELVRHTQQPIPPVVLFQELPPDATTELVATFPVGETSR
jgi:hypothetical protein